MSKKKRIIIGIIIMGVIIIISSIIGISVYHSKNTESLTDGESSTNSIQKNTITTTNEIINTDTVNDIQENVIVDEQLEENKTNDITEQKNEVSSTNNNTEQKKQESTTQSSVKKQESQTTLTQNNKTQSTQSQQTTQIQENKQNQETTQVKPQGEQQTTQKPTEQEQTTKEETKKEETTSKPVVEKCTNNNNHGMSIGNSGKWFKTKAEAVAEYDAEINKWGDKWTNYEITTEEYNKKCPYGYEVWTCPYCNLWTLNYYYN